MQLLYFTNVAAVKIMDEACGPIGECLKLCLNSVVVFPLTTPPIRRRMRLGMLMVTSSEAILKKIHSASVDRSRLLHKLQKKVAEK